MCDSFSFVSFTAAGGKNTSRYFCHNWNTFVAAFLLFSIFFYTYNFLWQQINNYKKKQGKYIPQFIVM